MSDRGLDEPFRTSDDKVIDLDADDFDAIRAINDLLGTDPDPDEMLDAVTVIQAQIAAVDAEVLDVLRSQSHRASRAHEELASAQADIAALDTTLRGILAQANQTQERVDAICKDIRAMDCAKRNLTQSISVLENFGTLTDALTELRESSSDSSKYAENANKLDSVLLLMEKFDGYEDIAKVEALKDTVTLISRGLHQQLLREFQLLWAVTDPFAGQLTVAEGSEYDEKQRVRAEQEQRVREAAPKFQALRSAALMATALERRTHCKSLILEEVMNNWMGNLRATTLDLGRDPGAPLADHFKAVFAWLADILETNRYFVEQWKCLPPEWQAQKELALRFCLEAEPHLASALKDWADATAGQPQEQRSTALLAAWGATRAFERRLMTLLEGFPAAGDGSDYDAIKHRARAHLQAGQAAPEPRNSVFDARLRRVFSPHLHLVTDWHMATLRQAMALLLQQDSSNGWVPATEGSTRLDSARAFLLECRKQSENALTVLAQSPDCVTAFLSTLADVLKVYCDRLAAHLPPVRREPRRDLDVVDLPLDKARSATALASTADFLSDQIPHLESFARERAAAAAAPGGAVSAAPRSGAGALRAAMGAAEALGAAALRALDLGLLSQLAKYIDGPALPGPGIQVMAASSSAWRLQQTGDTSAYARNVSAVLDAWGPVLFRGLVSLDSGDAGSLEDLAFEHVCTRTVSSFVRRLLTHGLLKLRKLNNKALTQLAIDLAAIRDALGRFPADAFAAALPGIDPSTVGYVEKMAAHRMLVGQKMHPLVTLVKVLQIADDAAFVTSYRQLLEQRHQSPEAMQQFLALLDVGKDTVAARLGLLRAHSTADGGGGPGRSSQVTLAGVNANGALVTSPNDMSARSATVFSGMSSTLLTASQGKAFKEGTERFVGQSSALLSTMRERFSAGGMGGANLRTWIEKR